MYFTLSEAEIAKLARIGERQVFQDGELKFEAGKLPGGMMVVLSGAVAVSRLDVLGRVVDMGTPGRRPLPRRGAAADGVAVPP